MGKPETRRVDVDHNTLYEVWCGTRLYWRRIVNNNSPQATLFHTICQKEQQQIADLVLTRTGPRDRIAP